MFFKTYAHTYSHTHTKGCVLLHDFNRKPLLGKSNRTKDPSVFKANQHHNDRSVGEKATTPWSNWPKLSTVKYQPSFSGEEGKESYTVQIFMEYLRKHNSYSSKIPKELGKFIQKETLCQPIAPLNVPRAFRHTKETEDTVTSLLFNPIGQTEQMHSKWVSNV